MGYRLRHHDSNLYDMAVDKWIQFLKPGQHLSIAEPSGLYPRYGWACVLKPLNENEDVFVRYHSQSSPKGVEGFLPAYCLVAPIKPFQFEAARQLGWPADPRVGMVITNQITVPPIGQA